MRPPQPRRPVGPFHLDHARHLFLAGGSRRESIRASLTTPVAAFSFGSSRAARGERVYREIERFLSAD